MLKLSIAITTYNHEAFIIECLQSIVEQNLCIPYEIIIGDDFSTDNTVQIIRTFLETSSLPVQLIARENNCGYTSNFYDVLYQCQGEYIAVFDGDDLMLPDKLNKQVHYLDVNPKIGIVGHTLLPFLSTDPQKKFTPIRPTRKKPYYTFDDFVKYGSIFGNSSKMFRKALIPSEGFTINVKWIADLAFTLEIMQQTRAGFIFEPLALYRRHSQSIMSSIRAHENFADQLQIIRFEKKVLGKQKKKLTYRYTAFCLLFMGKNELENGNYTRARYLLSQSLKYNPFYRYTQYIYWLGSYLFPKTLTKMLQVKS